MPLMEWHDNMSVGIPDIDSQHQKLVAMLNDVYDGMQQGKSRETLDKVLDELIDYTVSHFKFEEGLLLKTGYPDYENHKKQHDDMAKKALDIQERFKKSTSGVLSIETTSFLKNWIINHIMGTDKKYTSHLIANGVR